jgi:regulatory protein
VSASAWKKALDLLARRPHFRQELEQKLLSRGFPPEEVEAALEKAGHHHYLDDPDLAARFIAEKKSWGRLRLRSELRRRGVDADIIEASLDVITDEDELGRARLSAQRFRATGKQDARALVRKLAREGFAQRVIFGLLDELGLSLEHER